jgi:cyclic nucleotide-binding protein
MKRRFAQRWYVKPELGAILAQLLALVALGLGLQFVVWTTGGTLFLFSTVAPLLILVSIAIVGGLALWRWRQRHSMFHYQVFHPGEVIFREGEPASCAYFIDKGEVEVSRMDNGREQAVARLSGGDYFGEMGLLSDRTTRSATVRALAETRVAVVGRDNFLRMIFTVASFREDILNTAHGRATGQVETPEKAAG